MQSFQTNHFSSFIPSGQFLSQVQRYAEAANQYLEAFKLAPTEYEFAVAAATAFRQAGHNQKAEQMYKEALSLRPMVCLMELNFLMHEYMYAY